MPRKRRGPATSRSAPPPGAAIPITTQPRRRSRWRLQSVYGAGVGTKPTFKRLARRGGVKRISMFMSEELRGCLFPYIQGLLRDTMLHTKHDYRTTVTAGDVVHALRQSGRILYGFAT